MTRHIRDIALTALAPLMFGTTYIVTTEMLPADRPMLTSLLRALPAGLLLIALARKLPKGVWWWRASVIGALNITAFFALIFIAAYRLPGGVAAVVSAAGPLAVAALSILVLRQQVRLRTWLLGIAGVTGVGMVMLNASAALDTAGILAGLGSVVAMSSALVLVKRWGPPPGANAVALAGWQLTAGGVLLIPLAFLIEGGLPAFTSTNVLGYLYLGLINTALGYWLWFRGLARLSVVPMSFLGLLSPLSATILGWLVLGEALTAMQLLGMAIAFAATLAGQLGGTKPPQAVQDVPQTAPTVIPAPTARRQPVLTA